MRPLRTWLLAVSFAVAAQWLPAQTPTVDLAFRKTVLPNGLTVLVHEDRSAAAVAFNLIYLTGSGSDPTGRSGLAHLVEHIMAEGSAPGRWRETLAGFGASDISIGASTFWDFTSYRATVPTGALDAALWIHADALANTLSVLTQEKLDRARNGILSEVRRQRNQPYGDSRWLLLSNVYPAEHPYHRFTGGLDDEVTAIQLDDVRRWYRTHMVPSNAVLTLVGDLEAKIGAGVAAKYFGPIPPGQPMVKPTNWPGPLAATRRFQVETLVASPRVYLAWDAPPAHSLDADALSLICRVLAGGRSSRLFRRLVTADRLATEVAASVAPRSLSSQVIVWATVSDGASPAAVEHAIDDEISQLVRDGPSAEEIAVAKTQIQRETLEEASTLVGRSRVLGFAQALAGDAGAHRSFWLHTDGASGGSLSKLAGRWLTGSRLVLTYLPVPNREPRGTAVTTMPAIDRSAGVRFPAVERATLQNGLKLVVLSQPKSQLFRISAVVHDGSRRDPSGGAGLARLTINLLQRSSETRTAAETIVSLERAGAAVTGTVTPDALVLTLAGLTGSVEQAGEVWADLLLRPRLTPASVEEERVGLVPAVRNEALNLYDLGSKAMPSVLTGLPIGLFSSGDEASLERITADQVIAFYRSHFRPDNLTVVASGDFTLQSLQPLIGRLLGGWQARGSLPVPLSPPHGVQAGAIHVLNRSGYQWADLLVGRLVEGLSAESSIGWSALNDILRDRLTKRFGPYTGATGGANMWPYRIRGAQVFTAIASVRPERAGEALREVTRTLDEIASLRPPTAQEIAAAQDRFALGFAPAHDSMLARHLAVVETVQLGLPDSYLAEYVSRVRQLAPDVLAGLARESASLHQGVVIIGDIDKIRPPLEASGLGSIKLIDSLGRAVGTSQ